jgi:hypothetical protein
MAVLDSKGRADTLGPGSLTPSCTVRAGLAQALNINTAHSRNFFSYRLLAFAALSRQYFRPYPEGRTVCITGFMSFFCLSVLHALNSSILLI